MLREDEEKLEKIPVKVDDKKPFGVYFKDICSIMVDEKFKATVKSALNSCIAGQITEIKDKPEFEKVFKEYSSWTKTVIDSIRKSLKPDVKQVVSVEKDDKKKTKKTGNTPIVEIKDKKKQVAPQPKTT